MPGEVAEKTADTSGKQAPRASSPSDAVDTRRIWRPRTNKCLEENDETPSWYKHKRHVIVFTYSGKPVYTRYGSEDGIVKTTGALSAIVSKIQSFFLSGLQGQDSLRYMVAGEHIFAFHEKGPLWLVCISSCGDTYHDMVRLLDRVHLQIISILTAGIEKTLTAHPNYDMRSLLGGTDCVVNSMIRWCTQDVYLQLEGFESLPLTPNYRSIALDALRSARMTNVLCGWIMAQHRLVSIISNRQYEVNSLDLTMLLNLIMSSASLRTGESWTPICLVHLSDKAFAYAYISFVEESDVGVVFLSTASDGEQFYSISQQAANIKRTLKRTGCLSAIIDAMERCPLDLRTCCTDDAVRSDRTSVRRTLLAPSPAGQWRLLAGIIHAAYYIPSMQQFFSSAIAAPYRARRRTKMLFRSYGRCRQLLRSARLPCQICIATDHECFYVSIAPEFHIYLAVPRGISTGVIGQFYQWMRSQESHIFMGSLPTW